MIKLSPRLAAIAEFVPDHARVVDIGCDHALLDIYLVQSKKNIHTIASDINANALEGAKKNINKYQLTDKIQTRLGSGLDTVSQDEINTIVMSGLGTHRIVGILINNQEKLTNVTDIIIQSNTSIEFLRTKLTQINYYIEKENLVKDNKIIYTVIHFKKGKKNYSKKELFFGPILLKENSPLFQEKNKEDLAKLEYMYKMIPKKYLFYKLKTLKKIKMYKTIQKS